jgi:ApbE superfamily uncharacterized protein (UPF0280 family)
MNTLDSRWGLAAAAAVVIFASGYGLARSGRPYNGLLFTVHKLTALAAVVLLAVTLVRANGTAPLPPGAWLAGALAGVAVVALFVTGALHSVMAEGGMTALGTGARTAIGVVHKGFPYVAALTAAVALLLAHGAR